MENTKKKNTWFIILNALLVVMVIGLTSYVVFDKVLDSKKNNETNKDDNASESKNVEYLENVDKNSEIYKEGKALYEKFTSFKSEYCNNPYVFEFANYNDMNRENRLGMAMKNSNDIIYNKNFSFSSDNLTSDGWIILDYYSKIKISDLEKSYKELFGSDKTFDLSLTFKDRDDVVHSDNEFYEEFSFSYVSVSEQYVGCKKENDEVVCYVFWGGNTCAIRDYSQYNYSEIVDDKLNVYIKFLQTYEDRLYSDEESKYFIDNISDEYYGNSDKLFGKYGDKAGDYKLVFAKDTNNNWYWEETKIVKE